MELAGEKLIPAKREIVWEALNDPKILKKCVPGCQSLTKRSDTEMEAVAAIKVGPISAKFDGKITLSELNAPVSYRITGEGQGGVAGFARGSAQVMLDEVAGGTVLRYTVDAQIGGKLAQLGGRLIDATARKMSEAFFDKFAVEVQETVRTNSSDESVGDQAHVSFSADSQLTAQGTPVTATSVHGTQSYTPEGSDLPSRSTSRIPLIATTALAALFAFLWLSGAQSNIPAILTSREVSPEFSTAVQLILIAAIGYLFGRISEYRK